ncbi:MAG: MBL fold metallo-hydrolase [Dehalococcoidia bacterium]
MAVLEIGSATVVQTESRGVTRYAWDDIRIYQMRLESMPGFLTNVYLVMNDQISMVDVGSNAPKAIADLHEGFATVNRDFNEKVGIKDVSNVILTHGHGDHFGMLACEELKGKRVYIHQADALAIKDYANHFAKWMEWTADLGTETGCYLNRNEQNTWSPEQFPINVSERDIFEVVDGQEILGGYGVYHTPGHTPGHICLKVGPIIFLGDHILSSTTPHQQPKGDQEGFGLAVYLDSLRKMESLGDTLGLAGHEAPIRLVEHRAREIEAFHHRRLGELADICREDKTLYQITKEYYQRHPEFLRRPTIDELAGDERFAALEEIKAHVEYLLENNRMAVTGTESGVIKYRSI